MSNKLLTLDNLYEFFVQQNKNVNFSSKESKSPIVVNIIGNFSTENNDMAGMMKLKLKVCHIDTNRNGFSRKYGKSVTNFKIQTNPSLYS